jgi:hypothetical protein
MPKKTKSNSIKKDGDLWIASRSNLKGTDGHRTWDERGGGLPNGSRFLEYADIALGLKKVELQKKRLSFRSTHEISKTDPYSQVK